MNTVNMKEARRWPGSEWLKDHPRWMEALYDGTKWALQGIYPIIKRVSPAFSEKLLIWN